MQAPPAHAAQHTPPTAAENTHHELPDIGIHEEEQHPHAAPAVANIHHDVAPHFEEPQHQAPHNAHHNVVNNAQLPEGAAGHQVHAPPTLGPSENVNENEEQQQAGSSQTTQSAGVNNQQEILNQMFMSGQDNIAEIVNGIIAALGI
ncbi:hypothetical protein HK102_000400 [Quaeritorhiza haematococci]|nr:hypothetical protein HK102_000400 [Quaeritorhiza haematococci]